MTKISYTNLKLKVDTAIQKFTFNNYDIEVLQYLPIEDKYDLLSIVAQEAYEEGVYNPLKLDMLFHLYLVFLYSNISFTDKQKEDLPKLYNILKSNKIIDKVLEHIPEEEYNTLYQYLIEITKGKEKYARSFAGIANKVIHDLPTQAQAAKDIIDNFDPEKYQNVINFATAANGNRPIN